MVDRSPRKPLDSRIAELRRRRDTLRNLSGPEALERILADPEPAALVHTLSDEDLYLLVHDVGAEDAHPLLALAAHRQKEHLLDMEIWDRDRIDGGSLAEWIFRLYRADRKRTVRWLMDQKPMLLEFLIHRNVEIAAVEGDQDPGDLGDGFVTFDQTFYLRVSDRGEGAAALEHREFEALFHEMMGRIAEEDYDAFRNLLLESSSLIPAEVEEESYRLRNVRLAEKGFLPFEEAVGIYQPVGPEVLREHPLSREKSRLLGDPGLPVPIFSSGMLASDSLFVSAVRHPANADLLERLQMEFAAVCNRIVSADRKTVRSRSLLQHVVEKADKTISLGLERLTEEAPPENRRSEAAGRVRSHPLLELFRLGYGAAAQLKWKAEKWRKGSWFAEQGLPLTFWGERWLGLIGGLLVLRPRYYEGEGAARPYREFATMEEIRFTDGELDRVVAFDDLLARMAVPMDRPEPFPQLLTYKNLVLTLWARRSLGLKDGLRPISPDRFRRFLPSLWSKDPSRPRTATTAARERFLAWLSERSGLPAYAIAESVGPCLEDLFRDIDEELGAVPADDLDPRYIQLFLVR